MASFRTFTFISLICLILHLKIAESHFSARLLPSVFDGVCAAAQCGRGKCKPSSNGFPFYSCECDPGWKQIRSDLNFSFLPCTDPNCTINTCYNEAPPPEQQKAPINGSTIFDICSYANCGVRGVCTKTSTVAYDCKCPEGYANLYNVSVFPCHKICNDTVLLCNGANPGMSMSVKFSDITPAASSQNNVNQDLMLHGNYHWAIISVILLLTFT